MRTRWLAIALAAAAIGADAQDFPDKPMRLVDHPLRQLHRELVGPDARGSVGEATRRIRHDANAAPRGTSPAIVQRLAAEVGRVLKDPALVKRMTDAGLRASYLPPDRTTSRMSAEQKTFAQVIKDANIRAE